MANEYIYGEGSGLTNKFQILRNKIESEFNRRNATDSLTGNQINSSNLSQFLSPGFTTTTNQNNTIMFNHGDKTINILQKCVNNINTINQYGTILDIDSYINIVNNLASKSINSSDHGCSLICTGLCYGSCKDDCNGCTSCTGSKQDTQ